MPASSIADQTASPYESICVECVLRRENAKQPVSQLRSRSLRSASRPSIRKSTDEPSLKRGQLGTPKRAQGGLGAVLRLVGILGSNPRAVLEMARPAEIVTTIVVLLGAWLGVGFCLIDTSMHLVPDHMLKNAWWTNAIVLRYAMATVLSPWCLIVMIAILAESYHKPESRTRWRDGMFFGAALGLPATIIGAAACVLIALGTNPIAAPRLFLAIPVLVATTTAVTAHAAMRHTWGWSGVIAFWGSSSLAAAVAACSEQVIRLVN